MHDGTSELDRDDASFAAAGDFDDSLTDELRARFKGELEPGERLLWAARSSPPPVPLGAGYFIASGAALLVLDLGVGAIALSLGDLRARSLNESPMPLGIILCLVS